MTNQEINLKKLACVQAYYGDGLNGATVRARGGDLRRIRNGTPQWLRNGEWSDVDGGMPVAGSPSIALDYTFEPIPYVAPDTAADEERLLEQLNAVLNPRGEQALVVSSVYVVPEGFDFDDYAEIDIVVSEGEAVASFVYEPDYVTPADLEHTTLTSAVMLDALEQLK